jgi:hypothetical protein
MSGQRKNLDYRDLLKRSVEAGETVFITGGGLSVEIEVEATIKDLAKEAGKVVHIEQTEVGRIVRFDIGAEAGQSPGDRFHLIEATQSLSDMQKRQTS